MKIKDVWFNEGRWIVRCPECGSKTEIKPPSGRKEIKWYCGGCYPGKLAKKFEQLPNGRIFANVDAETRKKAAGEAWQNDDIHIAVMPDGWEEAQRLLRKRRVYHQGWYPGDFMPPNDKKETLAELEREQKNDPLLEYLREEPKEPGEKKEIEPREPKEPLTDKLFRSLQ